jgi:four helix bundle protein
MNYEEWVKSVPEEIASDSLWKMEAYRLGLFIADLGWYDVTKLMRDKRTVSLSDQLYRSLGSISSDIAEGYSRGTGKDRARFYEYSLGSARESRDWYYKGRHVLGEDVTNHRLCLLAQIIRLLVTMVPQQRGFILREQGVTYQTDQYDAKLETTVNQEILDNLLQNIPIP